MKKMEKEVRQNESCLLFSVDKSSPLESRASGSDIPNLVTRDTHKSHTEIRTPSPNPTLTHTAARTKEKKSFFHFPKSKHQGQGFFRSEKFAAQWRRNRRAPSPPAPPTNRCSIRSPRSFTATILPLLPLRIPIPKKPLLRPLRIGFFASSEGRDPFTPFSAPENVKLFFLFIIFALLFSLSFYCVLVFVTDSMWECCGCNYWIGKNIFWQEKNNKKKTRPCLAFAHVVYH